MKTFFEKINSSKSVVWVKNYTRAHKIITAVVILALLYGGYTIYKKTTSTAGETQYTTSSVSKGTLVVSISGTGQVSASNQIDVKSKASGDVLYVNVVNGQQVGNGAIIAQLDSSDASKAVRDAQVNLQSAQLALQKLQQPADTLSTLQDQNALAQAQTDLEKAYDDGFNNVSNTFVDLPGIMTGLQDIYYGTEVSHGGQDNISAYGDMIKNYDPTVLTFTSDAVTKYNTARTSYDQNFTDYKNASRVSATSTVDALIEETYNTTKIVADAVKSMTDTLNFVKDKLTEQKLPIPSTITSAQNSLTTYTTETNNDLLNLLNVKNTITSSNFTISEKTESLSKLISGADPLDISSSQLTVTQRQNALQDAQEKLADYSIRAPFAGTIAQIDIKKSDSISSGTTAATLITAQKLAEISLNEVDVSKIAIGDKATLTFDAIDGLTVSGVVTEIDSVGTVSQGVVTYNVKINFDTQDNRIKPGMTVSASIITDVKNDVLVVPNSAVKTQGTTSYVETFDQGVGQDGTSFVSKIAPTQVPVEIGIANDTETEIVTGLKEGDRIVTKTTTTQTKTTTAPSLFGTGGARTGTGAVRATGR